MTSTSSLKDLLAKKLAVQNSIQSSSKKETGPDLEKQDFAKTVLVSNPDPYLEGITAKLNSSILAAKSSDLATKVIAADIQVPGQISPADRLKSLLRKPIEQRIEEVKEIQEIAKSSIILNDKQLLAVTTACDESVAEMCLIGSAGTGKTTSVKEIVRGLMAGKLADKKIGITHKFLKIGTPAIAFVAYTNRAVRNIRKVLPPELASNCLTIHAILEYYFEYFDKIGPDGSVKSTRQAVPKRDKNFPLSTLKYIFIDEASMVAVELYNELKAALPADCRIMFIGDLNQLPPIYDSAILGFKLADAAAGKIPCVELTEIYRQALDNPIIYDAYQVVNGNSAYFSKSKMQNGGMDRLPYIRYVPFKKKIEAEVACIIIGKFFQNAIEINEYDPEEDCILIPYNKQFGTIEINKYVAQKVQEKSGAEIHEIFSMYEKRYYCVGDRVLFGKYEGKITRIISNPKYIGKSGRRPSPLLTRWGTLRTSANETFSAIGAGKNADTQSNVDEGDFADLSESEVDAILAASQRNDEAKRQASHIISLTLTDTGETINISDATEVNSLIFAYAVTVHKAQGAEWRKVYLIVHSSHGTMASRELLYTAMTRPREELIVLCDAETFADGVKRQRIKGSTLAEKAIWFQGRQLEKQTKQDQLKLEDE